MDIKTDFCNFQIIKKYAEQVNITQQRSNWKRCPTRRAFLTFKASDDPYDLAYKMMSVLVGLLRR